MRLAITLTVLAFFGKASAAAPFFVFGILAVRQIGS